MRKIVACGQRLRREGLVLVAAGSARWPMGGCAGPPGARDTVRRDACAGQYPAGPVTHRPTQPYCSLTLEGQAHPGKTRGLIRHIDNIGSRLT